MGRVGGRKAQRTGAELLDIGEGGPRGDAHLGLAEDDVALGVEAQGVVTDGVEDATLDPEGRAGGGPDDRAVREVQLAGDDVDARQALELATERTHATLQLAGRALQGDGVGQGEAALQLQHGADRGRIRRDGDRSRTRGEGVRQTDDAAVDGQAARPAGVVGGKHECTGLVLEKLVRESTEGERRRQRERLTRGHREGVIDRIEVKRAA